MEFESALRRALSEFRGRSAKSSRQDTPMSNRERWLARCAAAGFSWLGQDCPLCGACTAGLPALPEHCPRCALPSPRGALCGSCLASPPLFDGTTALWLYEFPCDRLVQALKYRGWLALAPFFARGLASRPLPAIDLIVPMPLHPDRLAQRGFNQATEIARNLAKRASFVLASRGARRVRNTA